MQTIAQDLAADGWTLRSGGAAGADQAFERGWWQWHQTQDVQRSSRRAEIYIPWDGFNDHWATSHDGSNFLENEMNRDEAEGIAASVHPAWDRCSPEARRLHTRNAYQVLVNNLDTPSDMLVCWAKPVGLRGVQGGTSTSFAIARMFGVKCFNLYDAKSLNELAEIHQLPAYYSKSAGSPNRLFV
jgi:hypothetical protein